MTDKLYCPRGAGPDSPFQPPFNGEMTWDREDNTCSYCGSLHPDIFMARLEASDVTIGTTDKNYKVYVHNDGGELFKQHYRNCPTDSPRHGPDDCAHWVTRETPDTKFYFQHLADVQKTRFIELLNDRKVKFAGGFGFYVLPYFCSRATAPEAQPST